MIKINTLKAAKSHQAALDFNSKSSANIWCETTTKTEDDLAPKGR